MSSQEIAVFDEESFGPAMRALNERQRLFVLGKVLHGANHTEAARLAGYSDGHEKSLAVAGHRLAHHPGVQAAILEECQKVMRSEGPRSIATLVEIRDDKSIEAKDRLKAAIELMNRSGLHAVSESVHHVEHHMTEREKDQRILALCAELGIAPDEAKKMLIAPLEAKKISDVTYRVIDGEPEAAPEEPAVEWIGE